MTQTIPTQRDFLKLAVPNMMAGMAVLVTQLVDIAYLGHLDSVTPLSGVLLAAVIFDFIFWVFCFLRVGTTGLVAQAVGREDSAEDAALLWRSCLLGMGIGATITVLQYPIGVVGFEILAGESAVEAAGRDYYSTHIWGAFPVMINLAIIGWLLGHGKSGAVWLLHTVWQVSNIVLNYVFIVRFGWGAFGAGLGTAIAEWLSLAAGIYAVYYHHGSIPIFDKVRILNTEKIKELLTLNSAIMLRTLLLMLALAAFTNISSTFGEVSLAANALTMKLFLFYAFVVDGYAIALETLAGQAEGKANKKALRRSFNLALGWSVGSAIFCIFLYLTQADFILSLLTEHNQVIEATLPHIPWICGAVLIGGFAFVYDGFFYGLARPRLLFRSMFVAVLAYAPVAYYAYTVQSTDWLWGAFTVLMLTRALTLSLPAVRALR